MDMKKFSWVQPNFQQGPKEFNAHYLPYSAGVLWAYVQSFEHLRNKFYLGEFVWKRDSIEKSLQLIADSDIVGFSTYVWNKKYNYVLAKKLREVNPDVKIIFGGPEPPITDPKFFEKFPFIDIMVKQEGEMSLKSVLESIDNIEDLKSVSGLLLNLNGEIFDTGAPERIKDLSEVPSPYLLGMFDKLVKDNPDVEWNATLETDRGCPYQCTFCDWGSLTYNKVKKFGLERVFAELEWIGKNKCGFLSITNANFGIFPERDNLIADKIIEVQKKYGYPYTFSVAWAKNQKQEVVDIVKKLLTSPGFNQGLTLSVQSMDLDVLENIKRKNLEQHKISEVFELCNKANIPVYTELILGLPGETLATWKENFWQLFKLGNHTGITVFQAQLLENAEMNLVQKKLYKLKANTVYDYMSGSYNSDELKEGIDVIISTKDMPYETFLDAEIFSWFINTFHINGITTFLSGFLYKYQAIEYGTFYEELFDFLLADEWFRTEMSEVREYYNNWMTDGKINHPLIGNIEIHGWNLIHRTLINIHAHSKYDHVFDLIGSFISRYSLDMELENDLMNLQKNYLINHGRIKDYPKVIQFKHDIYGYLIHDTELDVPCTYKFEFNEDKNISLTRFCENIYFQRRRNFGKAWLFKEGGTKPVLGALKYDTTKLPV